MDESPKRVGPLRPGEESGVLEVPSLTDQMDVTIDVEGEAGGNVRALTLIGLLTTSSNFSRANATHY
jgi:hypothetical protein